MRHKISVIIPVKNEEDSIAGLLESLENQTRQPDEIVIVDGGSDDRTVPLINSYMRKGCPIRLIRTEHAYPGRGSNLAIANASYNLIAMTDAGIKPDRSWLENLSDRFDSDASLDVVYGTYEPVTDTFFKECLAIVCVAKKRLINSVMARSHFIASSMMHKRVWGAAGGFPDLRSAEDRIFMERIEKSGARIGFAPGAKVSWDIPGDLKTAFRRFSLYSTHDIAAGRWKDWHRPVLIMYMGGAVMALSGTLFSPVWFAALAFLILLRAVNLIFDKSEGAAFFTKINLRKIAAVTAIML